jgi:acyl-CoA synthetase (AMP-forming)/AMP-acid ligase II
MTPGFSDDPRLTALRAATERLTQPGTPFEVGEETVLGERMRVFANRARSMRAVLEGGSRYGDRDGYVFDDGRRIRFSDLVPQVASLAGVLRDRHGIGPGDRVAICAANCPEWILLLWAVASLDAVLVAMNGWWTGAEMETALALTDPKLLVMDERRRARLEVDPEPPLLIVERDFEGLTDDRSAVLPDVPIGEDDPFILIFTSGTTGRPKAAVLSHRAVIAYLMEQSFLGARSMALAGITSSLPKMPPTVRLAPYPLFHVSGLSMVVSTVMSGSPTVWPLGRFDPGRVIELTKAENVALWGGGMTHVVRLLQHPDIGTIEPTQIIGVGVGGSATPPDVVRQIEERFPHLDSSVSSGYGSTETGLLSWAPGWMLKEAPDCVGPVTPTMDVRITADDGATLPDGSEGNIEARSAMSMLGYWQNDAANAETILPGRWIRTGDFGRLDDGVLFIASRRRDLIIRGGENIYPFEIEHRLDEHPDIVEAAVYGIDDPVHGQQVKAVVVVRPGTELTGEAVQAFCAVSLASYKVPSVVEITTDPLPRTATGKVMKQVLAGEVENTFVEE